MWEELSSWENNQVSRVYNCEDTDYVPEKVPFNADVLIIGSGETVGSWWCFWNGWKTAVELVDTEVTKNIILTPFIL